MTGTTGKGIPTLAAVNALTGAGLRLDFEANTVSAEAVTVSDAAYVAPGFVDLQVNGYAGVDYGSAPDAALVEQSLHAQLATGVTRLLPTVITGAPEQMLASIAALAKAREQSELAALMIAGLHIEGPHISPEDGPRGAHPKNAVRPPDFTEFERWQEACGGLVKLVTLAPEWPGALAYIERLSAAGVLVGIGHTAATGAQIRDAVSAGARLATHLGNATFPAPPKFNPLWDQLADDRLAASLIADGHHVPSAFLTVARRSKPAAKLVLVTDAASPAGAMPGRYRLGEVEVELHPEGRVTLAGGHRLAGSVLRMDRAVTNMMCLAGATLAEAVAMATLNPAKLLGLRQGLSTGDRADFVEFTLAHGAVPVRRVWLAGREVYSAL